MLFDVICILLAEVAVDWVKHSFITKFNVIPSNVSCFGKQLICMVSSTRDFTHMDNLLSSHPFLRTQKFGITRTCIDNSTPYMHYWIAQLRRPFVSCRTDYYSFFILRGDETSINLTHSQSKSVRWEFTVTRLVATSDLLWPYIVMYR